MPLSIPIPPSFKERCRRGASRTPWRHGISPCIMVLSRGRHLLRPKLTPLPRRLGRNDGYCRLKGVLLQAWNPPGSGYLDLGRQISTRSIRVHERNSSLGAEVRQRHETTAEAVLLAWLLKYPAKIQLVLGTSRPDRLPACVKALSVSLSREEWYSLFAAARGAPMP
jgi:aryl-alcohol dehydrogenase-like predicted oxidoreductase